MSCSTRPKFCATRISNLLHHVGQRFYMSVCQNDAVNVKALANCPTAIQRRVLRFWLGGDNRERTKFYV